MNKETVGIDGDLRAPSLGELNKTCQRLMDHPSDMGALACLFSQMNIRYYGDVLNQAKQSFRFALVAAGLGTILFSLAAWTMYRNGGTPAWVSLASGTLLQVISGTCFYLYRKASSQFALFHICLDRSNRFIMANMLCENLSGPTKDETRAYLVHVIAEAKLLTADVVNGRTEEKIENQQQLAKSAVA